jgi:outer membrane biosynthesis protein TonB
MNMHRYKLHFPYKGVNETTQKETEMSDLMPPTEEKAPKQKAQKVPKAPKEPKEPKEPSNRSSFAALYPKDAVLTVLVDKNPKKAGSAAAARFDHAFTSKTVGEFLEKGGRYSDIIYGIPRNQLKVG